MTLVPRAIAVFLLSSISMFAQDWPYVGRDADGTRHSSLALINRTNVAKLEIAWTFDTEDWSDGKDLPSRSSLEATPLVIDGVLYIPSPMSRLFALDAETGKRIWVFDAAIDKTIPRNLFVNRGVSSWTDGKKRLIYLGDIQGRLWAVHARTGKLDRGFGESGKVDLRAGMADGFPESQYGLTSPTAVCGDVVVAEPRERRPTPRPQWGCAGLRRAFRQGALALPHSTAPGRTRE
jgi:quinoprotein glucose dehydrogenase